MLPVILGKRLVVMTLFYTFSRKLILLFLETSILRYFSPLLSTEKSDAVVPQKSLCRFFRFFPLCPTFSSSPPFPVQ
jgi:hypothetical protein